MLSIIIIFTAHQMWDYLKTNYTIHKVKDYSDSRASKYKSMLEELEMTTHKICDTPTNSEFICLNEKAWVQKELDEFIQSL